MAMTSFKDCARDRLATLLEGAGYRYFSKAIEKFLKNILWWKQCTKSVFEWIRLFVKCSRLTISSRYHVDCILNSENTVVWIS